MQAWRVMVRVVLVAALAGTVAACSHPPDEAQVRAAINQATDAARSSDAGDLADVLSDAFDGNHGELDKRTLVNLLRLRRLRSQSAKILLGPVSLERRGKRFVATFTMTIGGGGHLLPTHLGAFHVRSAWRDEDGQWRCYTATWKRVLH